MRKTDISKYTDKIDVSSSTNKNPSAFGTFIRSIFKIISTALAVLIVAGLIVAVSLGIYLFKLANEPTGIDLDARSLNLSSFIYIEDPETEEFIEYQTLYGTENRIWVDLNKMPEAMPEAIIAIEDKRFFSHHGVDLVRTGSAIATLLSGTDAYGGSTLTQQLIKNITDDNEVSLTRKLREIFRALNIEREYSKDDILEAYLNVVNFGNNAQGVEAASQLYFDKSISECSICECAAIAGITQNPAKWNPLVYPENNKIRREIVLHEMYDQEFITKAEYDDALKQSENLQFIGYTSSDDDEEDTNEVQNWYIDQMYGDLVRDLAKFYDLTEEAASEKLFTEGLKIYCAMDKNTQEMIEAQAMSVNDEYDSDLQCAAEMIDFDGRVIACTGSSKKKEGNLLFDRASDAVLQPGSSIKAVMAYPLAMDMGIITYGSLVLDQPIDNWKEDGYGGYISGPNNAYGSYNGYMSTPEALSWSSNAAAVNTLIACGLDTAYDQATVNNGFRHLDPEDAYSPGALSIGGMEGGVTVREMASAATYLGSYGVRYEPYTYYYVTDNSGQIILDNRNNDPIQQYKESTGYIMNRELIYNVQTSQHSASPYAAISGWEISGKTGTTDDDKDIWFVGVSPYCSLAVWIGYDNPDTIPWTSLAAITWHDIMEEYLLDKTYMEFEMPSSVTTATYCKGSGMLAAGYCGYTGTGYYATDEIPDYCTGEHLAGVGSYSDNSNHNSSNSGHDSDYNTSSDSGTSSGSNDSSNVDPGGNDNSSGGDNQSGDASMADNPGGGGEDVPAPDVDPVQPAE